ncbi:hypothetical protein [Polyangium aurulentum]|uniref:hypothetical protein n=1 Tax=Polyangium aurulentum TaxID=2567896 RepID=UPI0019813D73|nr:hypothetical protein [Polyangium aurulentum]UQA62512.1 hypothetical protein E8A73_019490 [Polyangium aurulentum]
MRAAISPALRACSLSALVALFAACTADGRDLFGVPGGVGMGGAGGEGGGWTTASSSSSGPASSSSSSSSAASSSSSASSSSASSSSSSASSSSSSGSGGGSTCAHEVCSQGDKLDLGCESCVDQVCAQDPFCCEQQWDGQCVGEAQQMCNVVCCGNGACNNGESCMGCPADCGSCACGDGKCDGEDCNSCPTDCGVCADCPHSVCVAGEALDRSDCRDPCVDQTCAQDSGCCTGNPGWNKDCSLLADSLCGADACITTVCTDMPDCCTTAWTQACIDAAKMKCGTGCNCAHSICQEGGPLDPGCNPCVTAVCKADAFCCNGNWDGICVGEVASVCGISCN